MKIILPIEEGYFNIIPKTVCGVESFLIIPEIDAKWNDKNLHFRSLIVDKSGNVLSCGFKKFFNLGEKNDCYPDLNKFNDWVIEEKRDGSLLIIDYINGKINLRTRGSSNCDDHENSFDFEAIKEKYPKIERFLSEEENISLLFEIESPNNIIVIRPKELNFYFLGAIDKDTLQNVSREKIVEIWKKIGCPPTPQTFLFETASIEQIVKKVKEWKGKEGLVISYNNNQNRVKIKTDWYCFIHKVKSKLNSINNLIEYYIDLNLPNNEDFFKAIESNFDYEIAVQLKEDIEKVCTAGDKAKKYIDSILDVVHDLRNLNSRKEQARYIKSNFNKNSSIAFCVLDNKILTRRQWIELINQKI